MQYFCPKCDQRFDVDGTCPEDHCDLLPVETAEDLIGRVVDGRFEIIRLLGEGGMGSVYVARQRSIDRLVALKILKRELMQDATVVKRFLLEAKAASRLSNVHTITIHDFGKTHDGLLYIAMELLNGQSLRERLRNRKRLSVDETVRVLDQAAESLVEAHTQGIVHRDLKPENIFLAETPDGEDLVKVLDFGIARAQSIAGGTNMTNTGAIVGTPAYLSPEAIVGQKADERADIYALGIVMYELLTGMIPFSAETPMQILMMHIHNEPAPLDRIDPPVTLPRSLHRFLWRCLAKDREQRPRNAREFRAELRKAVETAAADGSDTVAPLYTTSEGFRVDREGLELITTKKQALPVTPASGTGLTGELAALESRPRLWPWLLAGVVLLVALVGALFAVRGRFQPEPAAAIVATIPEASPPKLATPEPPAPEPPRPEKAAEPPRVESPPVAVAVAPPEVTLTVVSTPDGAAVLVDGAEQGTTPWMKRRALSTESLSITLRLPGHADDTFALTPDQDRVEQRTLRRVSKPKITTEKKRDQVDELMP